MPLFDRLIDLDPTTQREKRPLRTLGREDLLESVRLELERLFSTRSGFPGRRLEGLPLTVIDYGIPDFGWTSAASTEDREYFAAALAESVRAFEPRLAEPKVILEPAPRGEDGLVCRIEGRLLTGEAAEPVAFMTSFAARHNGVKVHAVS